MATVRKYSAQTYATLAYQAMAKCQDARSAPVYAHLAYRAMIKCQAARKHPVVKATEAPVNTVGRCVVDGEPLKASHKVTPVEGTVREHVDHERGTCPLCGTLARLSAKGFMSSHVVRHEPMGASPALSERSMDPTDTGARVGDPESGNRRRAAEVDGAFGRGTVSIKVGEKTEDLPATEENLRTAITQTRKRADGKRKRADQARAEGDTGKWLGCADAASKLNADAAKLERQLRGAVDGTGAFDGVSAPGQRDHGRSDGSALAGSNLPPRQLGGKYYGRAGTMALPIGRVRPDEGALGRDMSKHDKRVKRCADMDCSHIVGGDVHGAVTWSEYKTMGRKPQNRVWAKVKASKERAERERACMARKGGAMSGTGGLGTHDVSDVSPKTARIMRQRPDGRQVREYLPAS